MKISGTQVDVAKYTANVPVMGTLTIRIFKDLKCSNDNCYIPPCLSLILRVLRIKNELF